jgi:hypothetical protein
MKIPLRIITREIISSKKKFSFLKGLRTLWSNLKVLFTKQIILTGGDGWFDVVEESRIISDYSLVPSTFHEQGTVAKFIKTPDGTHDAALRITQDA